MASQITSLTVVYSIAYSDADQRKHQSSASLAFVRGIHRRPVSPNKGPVTRKLFPFDDVIMVGLVNPETTYNVIELQLTTQWFVSVTDGMAPSRNQTSHTSFLSENRLEQSETISFLIYSNTGVTQLMVRPIWQHKSESTLAQVMACFLTATSHYLKQCWLIISKVQCYLGGHDDVIKWKHFPHYWPFVRWIHWSPVNSHTKASDAELWCFLWSASE